MNGEAERLQALTEYRLLDTPPEPRFDAIVADAASQFGAPSATITLVDRDRQWFKARLGIEATETPIAESICAHVIGSPEVMVIADASADTRFRDMACVTGEGGIRFYAGAPLTLRNGARIGTLCVIDTEPRDEFDEADRRLLAQFAARTVAEFELEHDFRRDGTVAGRSDAAWLVQAQSLLARASVALGRAGASAAAAGLQGVIDQVDDLVADDLV